MCTLIWLLCLSIFCIWMNDFVTKKKKNSKQSISKGKRSFEEGKILKFSKKPIQLSHNIRLLILRRIKQEVRFECLPLLSWGIKIYTECFNEKRSNDFHSLFSGNFISGQWAFALVNFIKNFRQATLPLDSWMDW